MSPEETIKMPMYFRPRVGPFVYAAKPRRSAEMSTAALIGWMVLGLLYFAAIGVGCAARYVWAWFCAVHARGRTGRTLANLVAIVAVADLVFWIIGHYNYFG